MAQATMEQLDAGVAAAEVPLTDFKRLKHLPELHLGWTLAAWRHLKAMPESAVKGYKSAGTMEVRLRTLWFLSQASART